MKVALAAVAAALVGGAAHPIVVTRDSLDLPAGCSPREVAQTIVRFFDAYNRRDLAALDRMFAPPRTESSPNVRSRSFVRRPTFRWYTTADVRVLDRERLLPHFGSRKDELRLRGVDMSKSWVLRSVGFGFRALRDGRPVHGKGELHCPSKRFYVWSEAPDPDRRDPDGAIIAESRSGRRPTAQEITPDYRLGATPLTLAPRCGPAAVHRLALTMLRAFNVGDGRAFARRFTRRGQFHPYTATISGAGFVGRDRIEGFVRARYEAGDGFTATGLHPPRGTAGPPDRAVYQVDLNVTHQTAPVTAKGARGAKIVVDCRSGLLSKWVGPALPIPS